jgi:ABC-type multidrug transport system permease subunit
MTFSSLGAMLKVPEQYAPRSIFYKHQDANFFPTWTFVAARSIAGIPLALMDGLIFGTITYWCVGLSYNNGATAANFFMFLLLLVTCSVTSGLVFSVLSSTIKEKSTAQACMTAIMILLALFCGFTVQPDVIPR